MIYANDREKEMQLKEVVKHAIDTNLPEYVQKVLASMNESEAFRSFLEWPDAKGNGSVLCHAVKFKGSNRKAITRLVIEKAIDVERAYAGRDKNNYWGPEVEGDHPVLNRRNVHNLTALHQAVRYNNPTAVLMLVNAGADVTLQDDFGLTPYTTAIMMWNESMNRAQDSDEKRNIDAYMAPMMAALRGMPVQSVQQETPRLVKKDNFVIRIFNGVRNTFKRVNA